MGYSLDDISYRVANVVPFIWARTGMYLPVINMLVLYLAITITLLGLLVCYSLIYEAVNTYSIFIYTCTEAAIPYIGASICAVQGDGSVWT